MPDRAPQFRYRGNVRPSAEVSRPVAAYRNAVAGDGAGDGGTGAGSSATLDIFDVIDSYGGWWGISATEVDAALKAIGDVDTLYVRLNSPGGEATEGVAIANLLRAHKADVRVTVYGLAASAASYIAIAGDTVSMGPGSLMFVHDALNIVYGDAADLRKVADTLDTISDSIAGLYVLKAGGTIEQWRAAMHADTWYSAEAAVAAKLADRVGLDPNLPDNLPPVEESDEDATVIEIDVEISPAARAAARRFDLSMLPNAPAALAPKTPAEPPETPTETEEADTMSDTLIQGLRERFGLAEDADEAAITAKLDELEEAATKPTDASAEKPAAVPEGSVVIDADALEELRIAARAGAEARAIQRRADRDATINAAIQGGHIAPGRREHWQAKWDADPEGVAASIAELVKGEPIYPTTPASGYASDDTDVEHEAFSDDQADELAALAGLPKGALK